MRMPIAFSECRVQREFHHDNLLQWVFLVALLARHQRESDERETNCYFFRFIFYYTTPPSIYTLLSTVQSLYLKLLHHHLTFSIYLIFLFLTSVFYLCLLSPLILLIFLEFFSPFLLLPLFIIPLFPLSLPNKSINMCNSDIVSRRIQESHPQFPTILPQTIILNKPPHFLFL